MYRRHYLGKPRGGSLFKGSGGGGDRAGPVFGVKPCVLVVCFRHVKHFRAADARGSRQVWEQSWVVILSYITPKTYPALTRWTNGIGIAEDVGSPERHEGDV